MKPNNMGIKSCVLMPLKVSWREKIKISPVFSVMAKKVSKMGEMWNFGHFWHFLGSCTKHRWDFDFFSSGCVLWYRDTTFDTHIVRFHEKKYFFHQGSPLWIFGAKINVAPPRSGAATKNLAFLESWDHLATKNSRYRFHRRKIVLPNGLNKCCTT